MYKGQQFRNRKTGAHVRIVEIIKLQTKEGSSESYRLNDTGKGSLTEAQIKMQYDKIAVSEAIQA